MWATALYAHFRSEAEGGRREAGGGRLLELDVHVFFFAPIFQALHFDIAE